ncbi:MAG: 2-aminoethylphosphonate--pyruvate transaminase [Candidatus Latescibacterota bacterium]|nr:2-aminoethylphosphonate--pyruvate transaminase [Candidatus Latescibacterota bacterium]
MNSTEPYLLTPGPLTTSRQVKEAMLRDWGSWDTDFRAMTSELRKRLLAILDSKTEDYECIPIQGSGTYAVEAMLSSLVSPKEKVLVLANGAYGLRAAQILEYLNRPFQIIDKGDYSPPRGIDVKKAIDIDPNISHIFVVQCETSSGILNPVEEIAEVTYSMGKKLLIDSMSAFGAISLSPSEIEFEAFTSSANKCLEGVPGFGFVFVKKRTIRASKGNSSSLSLDLFEQWSTMQKSGQWRFTPPTHVIAAFLEALRIHEKEGGIKARGDRYKKNRDILVSGMRQLGFKTLLDSEWLSPIIVTFLCPGHQGFNFTLFYEHMKENGFIIYPGKLTNVDSFRIGCIGAIDEFVMRRVIQAVESAIIKMGIPDGSPTKNSLATNTK